MVVSMLRNEMIDLPLKRRPPSDEQGAQHFGPPLVLRLIIHE
jgi:hypothetical protein